MACLSGPALPPDLLPQPSTSPALRSNGLLLLLLACGSVPFCFSFSMPLLITFQPKADVTFTLFYIFQGPSLPTQEFPPVLAHAPGKCATARRSFATCYFCRIRQVSR